MFNATFDPIEVRWKALSNYEMLHARKYAENVYYHGLAGELRSFGYEIENSPKGDFEIKGVAKEMCDLFSKRHAQIDQKLAELTDGKLELADGNLAGLREAEAVPEN